MFWRLRSVTEIIRAAGVEIELLRRTGALVGDLPIRLIEASHALHLAAVALSDDGIFMSMVIDGQLDS